MNPDARLTGRARGALLAVLAFAAGTAAAEPDYSAVEASIRALAPDVRAVAISETPVDGLLQVQVESDILYATDDGSYIVAGTLYETETRTNLTEQARSGIRMDLVKAVDRDQAIAFAPAEPDYDLLVFTDIDCGYCRKLHSEIDGYMEQGIAIRYMAFPRAGVGSASYDKAVSVWCADDPQVALTRAKQGKDPEPARCDNPVADQFDLGNRIGVSGTPAMITADGQLIPGYLPPDMLRQRLDMLAAGAGGG